jgi:hypothetical protein
MNIKQSPKKWSDGRPKVWFGYNWEKEEMKKDGSAG